MKKNVLFLLLPALAALTIMAAREDKGYSAFQDKLSSKIWTFQKASCEQGSTAEWLNVVYENSSYTFQPGNKLSGAFFGYTISGTWALSGNSLLLNAGKLNEEKFEIIELTDEQLALKTSEKGTPVILLYR